MPKKLTRLSNALKEWDKINKWRRIRRRENLNQKLAELYLEDPDDDHLLEIMEVKLALNMEVDKEEIFWEQRARAN